MKPINTHYNDLYFRSRLEARWAVYFDALGVKYLYEHEGFSFDGFNYLPDFYFPQYDFYGEVKHESFGDVDLDRWEAFSKGIKKPLVIFEGLPNAKPCRAFYFDNKVFVDYNKLIPFADKTKTSFGCFWYSSGSDNFGYYTPYKEAISTARKKRFEWDELQTFTTNPHAGSGFKRIEKVEEDTPF